MIDIPILVKDALRDGRRLKNYSIIVYGIGDQSSVVDFVIDNDTLVSESMKIDERMCSGDLIKFGLCEGSSVEFQYFNHPNIQGRRIEIILEVQYEDSDNTLNWYPIPMGFFEVSECSRQFSTGIRKVIAYNKLKSAYLDAKANDFIKEVFNKGIAGTTDGNIDVSIILESLLNDYRIESNYMFVENPGFWDFSATKTEVFSETAFTRTGVQMHLYGVLYGTATLAWYNTSWVIPDPSFPWPDRWDGNPQWYDDGFFRLQANMRLIYHYMEINAPSEILDTQMYCNFAPVTEKHTIREWLQGYGVESSINGTMQGIMRAANYQTRTMTTTPENYQSNNVVGDLVTNLGNPAAGNYPITIHVPLLWKDLGTVIWDGNPPSWQTSEMDTAISRLKGLMFTTYYGVDSLNYTTMQIQKRSDPLSGVAINQNDVDSLPDVTLRDLQSALFEITCQFGQLDRETDLFRGVELNTQRLYPAETLYPATTLYPGGAASSAFRAWYSKLWADEGNLQKFRNLVIKYKALDENQQAKEYKMTKVINADGTQDYVAGDNWLFRNLIWTEQQVSDYADAMVSKMSPLEWFPFEMWLAGLPYLETGDEIEITMDQDTYPSYILQRQLNGIQNLQDTYINGRLDIF